MFAVKTVIFSDYCNSVFKKMLRTKLSLLIAGIAEDGIDDVICGTGTRVCTVCKLMEKSSTLSYSHKALRLLQEPIHCIELSLIHI